MKKNAVVVRAGRQSRHQEWVKNGILDFDLIVLPYENLEPSLLESANSVHFMPGGKVSGWSKFFSENPDVFDRYDRFALMDDDLSCSASDISEAFRLGETYNLSIWQPSLTPSSYFTYSIFQANKLFKIRYTNYIEMMCPFMTSVMLRKSLPLFALGYETGIDRLWCCLIDVPDKAYAVLDSVSFHHTRSVGKNGAMQGFVGDTSYQTVLEQMEQLLGRPYTGTVAYAGINQAGAFVQNRKIMAILSLFPLRDWLRNPTPRYVKRFLISFRHNLTRPINNDPIDVGSIISQLKSHALIDGEIPGLGG